MIEETGASSVTLKLREATVKQSGDEATGAASFPLSILYTHHRTRQPDRKNSLLIKL
jgi:hypothetical protein